MLSKYKIKVICMYLETIQSMEVNNITKITMMTMFKIAEDNV